MRSNLVEALIGVVVLVVAGAFLYVVYTKTDVSAGSGGYRLQARFDQVGALSAGSDVRLSGIKIGSVVDQRLDPQTFQAVVEFTIADSVKLPSDTIIKVGSEGLLGGNYLQVEPGGAPDNLVAGEEVQFTEGYVDLMSLVSRYVFSSEGGNGSSSGN
ncbi:phospholipid/cholesterol/gamma-HCH transport system substrate-binding protein [Rhodothalassium salexigens DSM 2132]|uniref:Phospholipid/cholesterol/gamma-HCH transport system substrate-binding protein n=1 Tax=Rhodothalassium salexigens DSM 2132 TaxID=1188247 RepID=A0A4V2SQ90_RHOSA|nr:MlaD family protein [Rhodothalassium salexigens]MBB4210527.1 phospholipid/cholesterol/gamma-HCH transport system substrate-binding protein [Rhodothalassium salexigens DSM 2132]MBK1638062.1 outer membrane lipid asymmetry maintenance protein MlaD [Rhodothalassium salexigens DSM 2132]TCP37916.1 phospholipid/cholesterol/gamma-HCH transport system substrate-binding protein [Rhodothalassium salexigens DSM 2132]